MWPPLQQVNPARTHESSNGSGNRDRVRGDIKMNGPEFMHDQVVGTNSLRKDCGDESEEPDEGGDSDVPVPQKGNIGGFAVGAKGEGWRRG